MTECPCVKKHLTKECSPIYGHCKDGQRQIPLKLLDVAGLIPGASEGAGLGNKVQSGSDMRGSSWMISDMLTFSFTLWMFRDVPTRRERTRWDTTLREYDLMGRVMNRISTGYTTKFTHGSLTTSTSGIIRKYAAYSNSDKPKTLAEMLQVRDSSLLPRSCSFPATEPLPRRARRSCATWV